MPFYFWKPVWFSSSLSSPSECVQCLHTRNVIQKPTARQIVLCSDVYILYTPTIWIMNNNRQGESWKIIKHCRKAGREIRGLTILTKRRCVRFVFAGVPPNSSILIVSPVTVYIQVFVCLYRRSERPIIISESYARIVCDMYTSFVTKTRQR